MASAVALHGVSIRHGSSGIRESRGKSYFLETDRGPPLAFPGFRRREAYTMIGRCIPSRQGARYKGEGYWLERAYKRSDSTGVAAYCYRAPLI